MTNAEDAKLITLARSARARVGMPQAAAVRDLDGRSYAAAEVQLDALQLPAVDLAVAMAVSSGAKGLEAIAVVGEPDRLLNLDAAREFGGPDVPIHVADLDGTIIALKRT